MSPSNTKETQRIAKLLARAGIASRREVERMIAEGRIALNGVTIDTPATLLASLEGVTVDGDPVEAPAPARLFRYHKTSGLLTAEFDPAGRPTIYDRLPGGLPRVMPVGRLDLNTEGLLLLTNDGELKRELELPATGVERSYRARAYGQVTQAQLEELMLGIEIEGIRYGSINANIERRTGANLWIEMTLTEGKNREVRRVLEHLGLQVSRLIRTRYGPFYLGDLPGGDVDEIRPADLQTFRTVLSKPGGGKAASNLQFAVRARVEAAPRPEPVEAPARARRGAVEPERPSTRFTPRVTPQAARPVRKGAPVRPLRGPERAERPVRDGDRGAGRPVRGRPDDAAAPSRFAARGAAQRPERAAPGARRREADAEQPHAREARFTPRATPPRNERPEREDPRGVAKPARAARARAHRDTLEPRRGDITIKPQSARPGKGPAGGRGKPSVKPGRKPGRPPRGGK
ncbi:pseudouridine synthase [Sphingomonas xinjiangensis]|uniref:Pseudouridine synthase n=1 Tax=Sphingomonas xinjiangensis TaxID=643568 RepID=A0A840Y8U4_9SPHN|nr:23S rRNA pseudouridine2605 synthase [Sphingomonas xinjiangensis]